MSNLTMFGILYRMWLTLGNLLSSPYQLFLGIVMTFKSSDPTKDGTIMSDVKEDDFEVIVDAGTVPSREDVSLSEVITDPGTNTEEVIVSTSVPEDVEVVSDTGIVTSRVNKEDIFLQGTLAYNYTTRSIRPSFKILLAIIVWGA